MSFISLLIAPFLGSILSIIASSVSMLNTATLGLGPILQGIAGFMVWFVKEFFVGLGAIFQNPSTITVMMVLMVGTAYEVKRLDYYDCINQVTIQKKFDAIHKISSPPVTVPSPSGIPWPFDILN